MKYARASLLPKLGVLIALLARVLCRQWITPTQHLHVVSHRHRPARGQ